MVIITELYDSVESQCEDELCRGVVSFEEIRRYFCVNDKLVQFEDGTVHN